MKKRKWRWKRIITAMVIVAVLPLVLAFLFKSDDAEASNRQKTSVGRYDTMISELEKQNKELTERVSELESLFSEELAKECVIPLPLPTEGMQEYLAKELGVQ